MNRTQKKTLVLLLGILVGLGILLAVVSAVKRSSAQREAEEAAAQDAASVITETEAAYSSLTYDNGSATRPSIWTRRASGSGPTTRSFPWTTPPSSRS